ncbi:cytochrome P450 [Streptomyces sp. NBC_01754]|uniref:cytochrome P450 n=1 Tax=Streptomyces sp. NBC_01754 TaxID=2975930 RepID=UPI002DD8BCCB|nr:cytochrome P450 [Streptomyces sp. NBC_01754]WSC90881.1 cytochrome P450 [Streptomyces sp. NBC_01754]WSC96624.1 cytochrome P450 [Streptomyces sp. NBC_01754]
MRETEPVHHSPLGFWTLARYADVEAFLRAPQTSSAAPEDPMYMALRGGREAPAMRSMRRWMSVKGGEEHRRLRRLVARALTPNAVERLRPEIHRIVTSLIDEMGEGEIDLISQFATPVPIAVICGLLGIPVEDAWRCLEWTNAIANVIDPLITPQMRIAMNKAEPQFSAYIREQMELRRSRPGDDVLTMLMQKDANGDGLSDEDVIAQVLLLFNAGHETTLNVIGNAVHALLTHPGQLRILREHPELIEPSFEELVRFNAPVQIISRQLTGDLVVDGTVIPAGSAVLGIAGSAHRDPARFEDPDRLDVRRTGVRSLAFGSGPHACVAAMLGKAEVSIALTELLRRYETIEFATDDLQWHTRFSFVLGLTKLPLRVTFRR